jgi:site-specific DNA-methyltransferase (adenine-specific)
VTPYYSRSGITIYNADILDLLPTLPAPSIVITDPPYGIKLTNHGRSDSSYHVAGDQDQEIGTLVLDHYQKAPTIAFASPMRPWPGRWRQHLVWSKGGHVGGGGDPNTCWKPTWELIQVRNTGKLSGSRDSAILRFAAVKADYRFCPTPKPIALLEYLIHKANKPGDLILDPFAGSGSTLIAAVHSGRHAIGIEIDERLCDIAASRLEIAFAKSTGKP